MLHSSFFKSFSCAVTQSYTETVIEFVALVEKDKKGVLVAIKNTLKRDI